MKLRKGLRLYDNYGLIGSFPYRRFSTPIKKGKPSSYHFEWPVTMAMTSTTCSIGSLYYNGFFILFKKKVIIASEAILDGSCKLLHRIGQVQRQSTTMVVPEIIGRLQNYHTARHVPIKRTTS